MFLKVLLKVAITFVTCCVDQDKTRR